MRRIVQELFATGLAFALALGGQTTHAQAPPSMAKFAVPKTYCGTDDVPRDVTTIPWIGCFVLSAGHSATGTLSNHRIEVTVGADGYEVFTADGTEIVTNRPPQQPASGTNLPYVHVAGSGYAFCKDAGMPRCPTNIGVFSRNADHSVLFTVAECYGPEYHVCVLTQKNWDFYESHPEARPR